MTYSANFRKVVHRCNPVIQKVRRTGGRFAHRASCHESFRWPTIDIFKPRRQLHKGSFAVISQLACRVLQAGLDDWVPYAAVVGLARGLGAKSEPDAIEDGIATIRELVSQGLAVVGEVSDGGFFESSESLDATLVRVEGECGALDRSDWGFACWLQNTSRGDAQARAANTGPMTG
jgi:hypothetical protein